MRQRRFDGTNLKPRKTLENAVRTPSRVHAVLGNSTERKIRQLKLNNRIMGSTLRQCRAEVLMRAPTPSRDKKIITRSLEAFASYGFSFQRHKTLFPLLRQTSLGF
jgi:hypothetical protein